MTTVTLLRVQREVPCSRRGKPSYRWAPGYHVINPQSGAMEYPPVGRYEATDRARELSPGCKIEVKDQP